MKHPPYFGILTDAEEAHFRILEGSY
eukprot:IDg16122t1